MIEVAHPNRWATSLLEGFVTVYLGTLGRMIPIYSTPSAQIEFEERFNFKRTVEGRRKAEVIPGGRRAWSLNAQFADPNESATLQEFANGSWGRGPFWFLSADALVSNVLPPITKVFGNYANGGPMNLEGGFVSPFSMMPTAGGAGTIQFVGSTEDPPAIPGMKVTGSAYIRGSGASVMIQFFSVAGTLLSSHSSSPIGNPDVGVRARVTAMAPSGTASVRLTARDAILAARPAISWTDSVQPYGDGQGCSKAVVHGVSRDQVLAVPGHTFSNLSFTVTEVG